MRLQLALFGLFALAAAACTTNVVHTNANAEPINPGTSENPGEAPAPPCVQGETRCDGDRIATCDANGSFASATTCDGESVCREKVCRAPSTKQLAQATELASMLTFFKEETGWHAPIDWEALRVDGRKRIIGGDGSDVAYFGALYKEFVSIPQGHQGLYLASGCGKLVPMASISQRGACGRPHSRGIIVTNVKDGNLLALKKGDIITRVGSASGGAKVIEALAERPMCTASQPTTSFRDAVTSATFSDLLAKGDEIVIESADGTTRTMTVPNAPLTGITSLSCQDPFSRNTHIPVEWELRPDGVGVIRLPGFMDPEQTFPVNATTVEEIEEYKSIFIAKIKAAFDKVKSAPKIVWDVRGNGGGVTLVGLDIVSGFPSAKTGTISYCTGRVAKTDPPEFYDFKGAQYALTPQTTSFAYAGKVAIIIDGLNYSAADYFPLAIKSRTNATLVGAQTAGAFGAPSLTREFQGPPGFSATADTNKCMFADNDTPLEGKGVVPHVAAEYDPKDLAAGKDTLLERAISELSK